MLKKIRILKGNSQYDVFAGWQEALRVGFERRGVEAELISVADEAVQPADPEVVSLGFNCVRNWASAGDERRRHIAWSVDHPAFNHEFFCRKMENPAVGNSTQMLFADRSRCQFSTQVLGLESAYFMPHAAVAPFADVADWNEREFDLVCVGSCGDLEADRARLMRAANGVSPQAVALVEAALCGFNFEAAMPSDFMFWNFLNRYVSGDAATIQKIFFCLFPPLDTFLRNRDRQHFLSSLRSRPVHFFGSGAWDQVALHPGSVLHGQIEHREIPGVMRRSRMVINHAPTHRDGGHERVFDGLASGCAVLTTPSEWLSEAFGANAGLLTSPAGGEVALPELVNDYLTSDRREEICAGQERVRAEHTMDVRAGQLLQVMKHRWGLGVEGVEVCAE